MHTLTLVTVELPEIEEEPMVDLAIQNLLEECNIKKKKLPNNFMLDMHIEELNNRQNAFSRAVETEIETIMEPYGQNSEEFYVFEDYTEELKAEYENGAADCIKLSNGKIVSLYQYPLYGNFIIKDGLVYKKQFGQLKHEKRNKQAKKMTALPNLPYKKRYKTLVRKDSPILIPIIETKRITADIRDIPNATWRDVVAAVMEETNGVVPLSYLYEQLEHHSKAKQNKWWREKIRQTLQCNPSHFMHNGRGMWSLIKN